MSVFQRQAAQNIFQRQGQVWFSFAGPQRVAMPAFRHWQQAPPLVTWDTAGTAGPTDGTPVDSPS